jgi:MarR family transcriptional regulator, organic hydroperoxide resistance regulator
MRIDGSLSESLARVAKSHRGLAQALLAEIGLHPGQEFVLAALWQKDGRSQAELARLLSVSAPTVNKMVGRMVACDLVRLAESPTDSRIALVWLAAKGKKLRGSVEILWARLEARTVENLTAREHQDLQRLLDKVLEGLTRSPADQGALARR